MMIRTRFAPSPTGYLHIGSVRTALFSWAFARHHNGQFILRIEDTDQVRSTAASVQAILDGMAYLGLDYDEGPFYQSQRLERYQAVAQQLVRAGHAYYCYCSKARLEAMRTQQESGGQKPRYDGFCRPEEGKTLSSPSGGGIQPVIRLKNPSTGSVIWEDLVKGRIEINNSELDDLIIMRSDGSPTYNFCVVVDDDEMHISHVIRGDDHVNNTPRQINIFQALGAPLPQYAHLPMIFNAMGQKMSKRRDAVDILDYDVAGILPPALLNYLARLGWGHGDDEFFTMEQFCQWFDLQHVHPSPARFDKDKLLWLNAQHIKGADNEQLEKLVVSRLHSITLPDNGPALKTVIALVKGRAQDLNALSSHCDYFYIRRQPDPKEWSQYMSPQSSVLIKKIAVQLSELTLWEASTIHQLFQSFCADEKINIRQLAMPLRLIVCGTSQTPSIDAVLALIGQQEVLRRIADYA